MSTGVFAFRMLVCQFRRELTFDDVFGFWERLWAAEQMAHRQLKVCLSAHTCDQFCPVHCQLRVCSSEHTCHPLCLVHCQLKVCSCEHFCDLFRPFHCQLKGCLSESTCDPFCPVHSMQQSTPLSSHSSVHVSTQSSVLSFHSLVGSTSSLLVHILIHSFIRLIRRSFMHSLFRFWIPLIRCFSFLFSPNSVSYSFTAQSFSLRDS